MKFCNNCGQQLNDDATKCTACGAPVAEDAQPAENTTAVQPATDENADIQANRGIAWLAYCGLLFLIPLFARKNSEYCKFHVKQGATLCAVLIAYETIVGITMAIIGAATARVFWYGIVHTPVYHVFNILFSAGTVFLCVLAIIGIVNAAQGKKTKLPLISQIPWIETLMDKIYASFNN